jgi:hypothetical protein
MLSDFDTDYTVSEPVSCEAGPRVNVLGRNIRGAPTTGHIGECNINGHNYNLVYLPLFGADYMARSNSENTALWLKINGDIVGKTTRAIRRGNDNDCLIIGKYLFCTDAIYVDGFEAKIKFPQLIGGEMWNGEVFAYGPCRLMNVSKNYDIDVSFLREHKISRFAGGVVILQGNKCVPLFCAKEQKIAKEDECIICYNSADKFKTYNCGHMIVCVACHDRGGIKKCPECRADITVAITTLSRKKK